MSYFKFIKRSFSRENVFLAFLLGLGFLVRAYLTRFGNFGDVAVFAEWGEKYWQLGVENFYRAKNWYYSFPTYPPLSSLMYAGLNWLNQRSYVLAQIHNTIKIIPAVFIVYFGKLVPLDPFQYTHGYYLLLKLPAILADLGIGLIIFWTVGKITGSRNKSILAMVIYLFNPVTIFISSVWGQTESLIAFFGMLAFLAIYFGKAHLSLPLFFVGLYLKPTWAVLLPLYVFVLYKYRPKVAQLVMGFLISLGVFLVTTLPFSGNEVLSFTREIVVENMLSSAKGTARASVSAFNFYSIFYLINRTLDTVRVVSVVSLRTVGLIFYLVINFLVFGYFSREKNRLVGMVASVFLVGLGSYLFLTNMLERYFFAALAPMVILMVARPKLAFRLILTNLILLANLVWVFYRRGYNEIDRIFTNNNFLLIRILSILIVTSWILVSRYIIQTGGTKSIKT
jgi:Gpi18-like mannosyltransferase